jgi:hypothetical protein
MKVKGGLARLRGMDGSGRLFGGPEIASCEVGFGGRGLIGTVLAGICVGGVSVVVVDAAVSG